MMVGSAHPTFKRLAGRDARPTKNRNSGDAAGKGDPAGRPYGDRDLAGGKAETRVSPYGVVPKRSWGGKRGVPKLELGNEMKKPDSSLRSE